MIGTLSLDLRALKQSLAMDHLRCKSPEMVRKEIWTAWLGYNLIRKSVAQAALVHGKLPRQIGFAGTAGDRRLLGSAQRRTRHPRSVRWPPFSSRDRQPQRGRPSRPSGTAPSNVVPKSIDSSPSRARKHGKNSSRRAANVAERNAATSSLPPEAEVAHRSIQYLQGPTFSGQTVEEWLIPRAQATQSRRTHNFRCAAVIFVQSSRRRNTLHLQQRSFPLECQRVTLNSAIGDCPLFPFASYRTISHRGNAFLSILNPAHADTGVARQINAPKVCQALQVFSPASLILVEPRSSNCSCLSRATCRSPASLMLVPPRHKTVRFLSPSKVGGTASVI